jgi:hypothetical protein
MVRTWTTSSRSLPASSGSQECITYPLSSPLFSSSSPELIAMPTTSNFTFCHIGNLSSHVQCFLPASAPPCGEHCPMKTICAFIAVMTRFSASYSSFWRRRLHGVFCHHVFKAEFNSTCRFGMNPSSEGTCLVPFTLSGMVIPWQLMVCAHTALYTLSTLLRGCAK